MTYTDKTTETATMLEIPVIRTTAAHGSLRVLDQNPFGVTANFWLARITPTPARWSGRSPLDRNYIKAVDKCPRYQIEVANLSYGRAYEFGSDIIIQRSARPRTRCRIYCNYIGLTGSGSYALFTVQATAQDAMDYESGLNVMPDDQQAQLRLPPSTPSPVPVTALPLATGALLHESQLLLESLSMWLNAVQVMVERANALGYSIPALSPTKMDECKAMGIDYVSRLWVEINPTLEPGLMRAVENGPGVAQDKPMPVPPDESPATGPEFAGDLLDTIADDHESQHGSVNHRFTRSEVVDAARNIKPPAGPRPASEPHTVSAGSMAVPSHLTPVTSEDLPF